MKTILVVDDEPAIAEILLEVLTDEGYHVVAAHNGHEGLRVLAESRPHLVLSDLMMPIMDGLALCRAMQADPAHRTVPIVLMSAAVERAATSACRYAAVLHKPFDLDLVLRTVVEQIGEAEAPNEPIKVV